MPDPQPFCCQFFLNSDLGVNYAQNGGCKVVKTLSIHITHISVIYKMMTPKSPVSISYIVGLTTAVFNVNAVTYEYVLK